MWWVAISNSVLAQHRVQRILNIAEYDFLSLFGLAGGFVIFPRQLSTCNKVQENVYNTKL